MTLTSETSKFIMRGMLSMGEISFDDVAADIYRDNDVFQGQSLSKFRENWAELKNEMADDGNSSELMFFYFFFMFSF